VSQGKDKSFTLAEIAELLEDIQARSPPFWGETTQAWQNGRILWWKESGVKKPEKEVDARTK